MTPVYNGGPLGRWSGSNCMFVTTYCMYSIQIKPISAISCHMRCRASVKDWLLAQKYCCVLLYNSFLGCCVDYRGKWFLAACKQGTVLMQGKVFFKRCSASFCGPPEQFFSQEKYLHLFLYFRWLVSESQRNIDITTHLFWSHDRHQFHHRWYRQVTFYVLTCYSYTQPWT